MHSRSLLSGGTKGAFQLAGRGELCAACGALTKHVQDISKAAFPARGLARAAPARTAAGPLGRCTAGGVLPGGIRHPARAAPPACARRFDGAAQRLPRHGARFALPHRVQHLSEAP
eukprot:364529-Chlamydomonas_euryale.AAC.4